MAKGVAPSQDQLLELMKRAAEELKHAQEEARTAVLALQKEQAAHGQTEAELEQAQKAAQSSKSLSSTDEELLKDQIEAERENGKALAQRVKELEAALDGASAEREAMKTKVAEAETTLSVASQQDEANAAKLSAEHEQTIAALRETQDKAIAELRQAMEAAEAEHQGLLGDAAGGLVQIEQQLAAEKEKHQTTAQKLLETRARVRELEGALAEQHDRLKGLETAATQMGDAHQKALREANEAHARAAAELQAAFVSTQQELATVTQRWREVEHQYEALHREMLLTLEQRDEARRMMDGERAEKERLAKALSAQAR